MERPELISFQNNPLTLKGNPIEIGKKAPNFTAINNALQPVQLNDLEKEIILINSVPSLDTPVCEKQARTFNQEVSQFKNTQLIVISMDLPFAQKRFCTTYQTNNILTLSDYRDRDFGLQYGLWIKELGLLARSVILLNANREVVYYELVKEITQEPNYAKALEALKKCP